MKLSLSWLFAFIPISVALEDAHVWTAPKSERIVPLSYGANRNSEGIAEVDRILNQHIGSKG